MINGDAPLNHDLLKVSTGHGVTDVKKSVQEHGLGAVHASEINRHSAQLAYSFPSKCSAASDDRLEAQKFATEPIVSLETAKQKEEKEPQEMPYWQPR